MKRYLSILCMFCLLTSAFSTQADEMVEFVGARWDFNREGNLESFSPRVEAIGEATVSGGSLNGVYIGTDPFIYSPDNLNLPARLCMNIRFSMKNSSGCEKAKLYFITDTEVSFSESKMAEVLIKPNSDFIEYDINMAANDLWTGRIRRIRIDPVDDGLRMVEGSFSIDYMEIYGFEEPGIQSGPNIRRVVSKSWDFTSGGFSNWTPNASIGSANVSEGRMTFQVIGRGPYLYSPDNLNFDARIYNKILLKIKNETPIAMAKIFFITNDDTTYDEQKALQFTIGSGMSGYSEIIVDMSNVPAWSGSIKRLRFDPVTTSDALPGEYSIDIIEIYGNLGELKLTVDNQPTNTRNPLLIKDGNIMAPLEDVLTSWGAAVKFDDATKTLTAVKGGPELKLTINENILMCGDKEVRINRAPVLVRDVPMAAPELLEEIFGWSTEWDSGMTTLHIDMNRGRLLTSVFGNNMVLQQGKPVTVNGFAKQGEEVTVSFAGQSATVRARNGKWQTEFSPLNAGGPYELSVSGEREAIHLNNIMIGDVWVIAGEENAAFPLSGADYGAIEAAAANFPQIRYFNQRMQKRDKPYSDALNSAWSVCSPSVASTYSAVAYYFAKELFQNQNVPIGIMVAAANNAPAESFADRRFFCDKAKLAHFLDKSYQYEPASLYNGMIHPLTNVKIKGVLWYQGESNVSRYYEYGDLVKGIAESWRNAWNDEFPVVIMQLPQFYGGDISWAKFREAQEKAVGEMSKAALVSLIDTGYFAGVNSVYNRQPQNKHIPGRRAAAAALQIAYGQDVAYNGATLKSWTVDNHNTKYILKFDNTNGGLVSAQLELGGFVFFMSNGRKIKARAEIIDVQTVEVYNDMKASFVGLGYAFDAYPDEVTLYNGDILPALPFYIDL